MKPFDYMGADSVSQALETLDKRHRPLAGGTDLVALLKADRISVDRLIDIKRAGLPRGVETTEDGMRIGALTTLSDIEASPALAERHPAIVQATKTIATRQIRNRATLGGSLLQRPRCGYFRDPAHVCWLSGGESCLAVDGYNARHAIFGDGPCRAVHPSDLAGVLLALDASVTLERDTGERRLSVAELFAMPDESRRTETVIAPDELMRWVDIPRKPEPRKSVYLKVMDRKTWAFGLVGLAFAAQPNDAGFADARVVFTGVAPIPWRHAACEAELAHAAGRGRAATVAAAVEAVAAGASPLSDNGYKIDLARRLLRRALQLTRNTS